MDVPGFAVMDPLSETDVGSPTLNFARRLTTLEDMCKKTWQLKNPLDWTRNDVTNWYLDVVRDCHVDFECMRTAQFTQMNGKELLSLSNTELLQLQPQKAEVFINSLKMCSDPFSSVISTDEFADDCLPDAITTGLDDMWNIDLSSIQTDWDPIQDIIPTLVRPYEAESTCGSSSISSSRSDSTSSFDDDCDKQEPCCQDTLVRSPPSPSPQHTAAKSPKSTSPPTRSPPTRSPPSGSPAAKKSPRTRFCSARFRHFYEADHENDHKCARRGRKPGTKSSSPNLLHKFLMDKLNDASAYGKHIIWENKQEGVFKVLRTDVITEEWDKVKNHRKTDMTWDKLSRAIRERRMNSDTFEKLPKGHSYPRQKCFKFGRRVLQSV